MITNADLKHARRELNQYERQLRPQRHTQRLLLLTFLWLIAAEIAFFRHPHLQLLPTSTRLASAVFGIWSVPAWELFGNLLWERVQDGQMSLQTLWGILYGSLFALAGCYATVRKFWLHAPAPTRRWLKIQRELHRHQQGQLTTTEAAQQHGLKPSTDGIPLLQVSSGRSKRKRNLTVGVPFQREMGHTIVIAPTRAGKSLHLTSVLKQWQHSALVIDPKAEQCERMAGVRRSLGPIYNVPHHSVNLSSYYDWTNRNDLTELHQHLVRPEQDRQTIFAEKSRVLFDAAAKFALAHGLDPLRVLLEAGNTDMKEVLTAWETVARSEVRTFTNGQAPGKLDDRFVSSAWGTLTTRLYTYYQSLGTLTAQPGAGTIPDDWAVQKSTLFVTYPLSQLTGVGGAIAAMTAGMIRQHMQQHAGVPLLVAIDELPAVGLRNVLTYLATAGGYRITLLMYAQTYGQLVQLYGRNGVETLLANCRHQVWYPPADPQTADRMARMYGTELAQHVSFGRKRSRERFELDAGTKGETSSGQQRKELSLDANAIMALDADQVLCRIERQYVLRGQRLWPVPELEQLSAIQLADAWPPPAPPPEPIVWKTYMQPPGSDDAGKQPPRRASGKLG